MASAPSAFAAALDAGETLVLDGALATELEARGCNLDDPLWSAKVLLESPGLIAAVHRDYFRAGARVATTASYQASVPGFARRGLSGEEALGVVRESVRLADDARRAHLGDHPASPALYVAGSVGPYGAYLADGSEYRGDYALSRGEYLDFHRPRAEALLDAGADVLACETLPNAAEIRALAELVGELGVAAWFSVTLRDASHVSDGTPLARVAEELSGRPGVVALGVNCVAPALVRPALAELAAHTDLPLVAYPNSGEAYDPAVKAWRSGTPDAGQLASRAGEWAAVGARLIGGCCRTTPADIAALARAVE